MKPEGNPSLEACRVLEWPRFIALASQEARSEPAKELLRVLLDPTTWATNVDTATHLQNETQEITPLLDRDGLWGPLSELPSADPVLERLQRGSVLEIVEFALLRRWMYALDSWNQLPREEIRGERVRKALQGLTDPHEPLRAVDKLLTPEGELSERASPKLAALHQEIRGLRREIGIVLDSLLKSFSQKGILQENFSDVRDGRYVLPIKISHQNDIDGIVYEASASRQTVFVEPREVSPLNNRLRQRQNDLIQEVHAVLTEASKRLQPFAAELGASFAIIAHWDAVQARARLARHYSGKPVLVTLDRGFLLHQTAHPLLWWSLSQDQIIRNEIDFGEKVQTLLITGPNTGGKTVLLKTLGLAGICARTGFPFPGIERPTVPFFDSFFADLGDAQSIEQHLSSFAGHVMRFKEILEQASDRSLILLDELNTATDPEEGAALGRAFLETIMQRGALIVTTTHDPQLKALAVADARILNASMQFDENARTPTYRIALGVPGRSRALETAERLGIPGPILALARKYLSAEHIQFEGLLARLENDAHEASRLRREAQRLHDEAERIRKEWTERTEATVNDMMDRTRQRLRRILEQAQDQVRSSVQKLDEMKNRREVDRARTSLNETVSSATRELDSALHEEAPEVAEALASRERAVQEIQAAPPAMQPGAKVRVPKWKATGVILEVQRDRIKVAMGTLQMMLSPADIEILEPPKSPQAMARVKDGNSSHSPPGEIDLRGKRFEEAMSELGAYLDLAYRSGGPVEVNIIHGIGTGALREGTRKLLERLPYIKGFRDGGIGGGGAGATVVEFER